MNPFFARFPTPEAARQYLAAYQTTLGPWNPLPEEQEVETRFGLTHVLAVGAPNA